MRRAVFFGAAAIGALVLSGGCVGEGAGGAGGGGAWRAVDVVDAMRVNDKGVSTREVSYEDGGVELGGFYAFGEGVDGERPAVLIVHEWWGHNEYARERARELAGLGYAAFALDMYGEGVLAETAERAGALATPFYRDRALMRSRARAGLEAMLAQGEVDGDRVAVIGYCFGGTVALELARSGAALDAAVSFHGGLSTPDAGDAENITGTVMVANGAADPLVPMDERRAFIEEMESAGVDYLFVEHGGALHSFTNPAADGLGMDGVGYDPAADARSWRQMLMLFNEVFGEG